MIISSGTLASMEGEVNGTKALIFKTERFNSGTDEAPPRKRQRTSEDFISFCKFILEYENYESIKQEELREKAASPSDSSADSVDSLKQHADVSDGDAARGDATEEDTAEPGPLGRRGGNMTDEDSHDLITCFCLKPFAGRPMIECSECLTWIHLSCAKIRRNNIPEEFTCQRCREAKHTTRRSQRIRGGGGTPTPQRRRPST
ncbi:PHD finger protein 13 [Ixodes scapularis]|uniref:PHD finger protein 13 n=1 Tax=Ixodes scapularis TaxID=6945 RepID=UPI001A9CE650|nr:PHD finger protein 13 [Ixodes scapularis]